MTNTYLIEQGGYGRKKNPYQISGVVMMPHMSNFESYQDFEDNVTRILAPDIEPGERECYVQDQYQPFSNPGDISEFEDCFDGFYIELASYAGCKPAKSS